MMIERIRDIKILMVKEKYELQVTSAQILIIKYVLSKFLNVYFGIKQDIIIETKIICGSLHTAKNRII